MARTANAGSFKKGDARINRNGRPKKGESIAEKFRDALAERLTGDYTRLDSMIDAIVTKALKGDQDAIEFCIARGYGKLIDRVESHNINNSYDFTHLSMEERVKLLELIKSAKPVVPGDNPDTL